MAIFELPTGIVADTVGRRISFLLSVAVLAVTTLFYVAIASLSGGVIAFAVISIFMGLGFTFYSGAVEAWLVDALKTTDYTGNLDQVFARGSFVSGGAMLLGTVGGGLLGNVNLAWPYILRAGLLTVLFVVAYLTMRDRGFRRRELVASEIPRETRRILQASLEHGWRQRPVRLLMIVSLIQISFFSWAFYAWQPYFLNLLNRPDAVWIAGVIAALNALAMMSGNALVERLAKYCANRTTLLLSAAVVGSLAAVGVGLSGSFVPALVFLLFMMGAAGVSQPVAQAYLHRQIPSGERATIVSFNSMISSGGSIVSQTALGRISQDSSVSAGFVVGGLYTLLAIPVLIRLRNLEQDADAVDKSAGTKSACAAQGLPGVSSVSAIATDYQN